MSDVTSVVIIGGGPGGYEAALVGVQLGADVTLIEASGLGGAAVLTDCVPSKALAATAEVAALSAESAALGVRTGDSRVEVDLPMVNSRIKRLAEAQSADIRARLVREGVRIIDGTGSFAGPGRVMVNDEVLEADAILIATGARPRIVDAAVPDGKRILDWKQVYDLPELPRRLIVVGSGVTGAEFASAYTGLGSEVVLVSSRERVLPGEDPDAARVIENVFARRGMTVLSQSRAASARVVGEGVEVLLADGRVVEGSHVLMAVGSLPNTESLNLASAGVELDGRGFIKVDRVSRTSAPGVYAAGDVTGVNLLASVAAMQGRIAMWHALGDAVTPLDQHTVSSTIFTDPEIATVGVTQREVDDGEVSAESIMLALSTNARAKMLQISDGFVKVFCRRSSRIVIGAVVVGPRASELIHVLTLAVDARLTVDQLASTFTVYPSLSGSIAESARQLHRPDAD